MRLIDADALIYRVMGNGLKPITEQIFRKLIDDEPTIDAVEVEWIPCHDRLPSEQGEYLVTTSAFDDYSYVDVLSFHKGEFYETDDEWGDVEYEDVTAWMPLPKPYGEREGE